MRAALSIVLCCWLAVAASVTTANQDIQRTGGNRAEIILTPAAIAAGKVVKLGTCTVDGAIYGQALLIPNVTISGAIRQLAVVATMHGTIYGLNVSVAAGCSQLWSLHLADPVPAGAVGTHAGYANSDYYGGEVGCTPTPTIDEVHRIAYALCASGANAASVVWTLYKVNLLTGGLIGSPQVVSGEYAGTGYVGVCLGPDTPPSGSPNPGAGNPCTNDTVVGGKVQFRADLHSSRPGLLMLGGNIFSAFGSWADYWVFHGWLFGHSATDLSPTGVWLGRPNGCGAAIWQSGGGIASDGTSVYVSTGNGPPNSSCGSGGDTENVMKFDTTLNTVTKWVATDQGARDGADGDLSSGRCIIAINNTKIICGGKAVSPATGKIYVVNTSDMSLAQTLDLGVVKGSFNGMTIDGNDNLFFAGRPFGATTGSIYRFAYSGGGVWATSPSATSAAYVNPGAYLASSGTANGIIWAVTPDASESSAPQVHTLRALNPADLTEYANWSLTPGLGMKYTPPIIANGLVLVTTDRNLTVFGVASSPVFPMPAGALSR